MKNFKDNAGRDWPIAINVDAIKRVRALCDGLDLAKAAETTVIQRLAEDPVLLVDVLYALCKPQADAQGVSDEKFGAAMAGDAIDYATSAFMDELIDFFPSARRAPIRAAREKYVAAVRMGSEMATAKINEVDVAALMRKAFGDSSTGLLESPASTPAR